MGTTNWSIYCWLVRVSLFIELGGAQDLGQGGGSPWHFYDK